MNIFVVNFDPALAAQQLPDKYSVKMPLETCQMVSIIFSEWYHNWGVIHKLDGQPYSTKKGAFRNHPCTQWAASKYENLAWLICHGWALCSEYTHRYGKTHACQNSLLESIQIFNRHSKMSIDDWNRVTEFVRAMPDDIKYDNTIDTITAYRKYVASKPWVKDNYLRDPARKPLWV